jgi:predicted RNA binding protein YcfA (HicA-like mRNA interferase family)
MPKSLTPNSIIKILKRHGFRLKRTKGSHHLFQHAVTKRRVLVSLHSKSLPKGTLHEILKQADISLSDI